MCELHDQEQSMSNIFYNTFPFPGYILEGSISLEWINESIARVTMKSPYDVLQYKNTRIEGGCSAIRTPRQVLIISDGTLLGINLISSENIILNDVPYELRFRSGRGNDFFSYTDYNKRIADSMGRFCNIFKPGAYSLSEENLCVFSKSELTFFKYYYYDDDSYNDGWFPQNDRSEFSSFMRVTQSDFSFQGKTYTVEPFQWIEIDNEGMIKI